MNKAWKKRDLTGFNYVDLVETKLYKIMREKPLWITHMDISRASRNRGNIAEKEEWLLQY